jgi:ribonuclease HI
MSAILHQVQGDTEVPLVFASKTCKGAEKKLASAEGELLAVVFALAKFKQYVGRQHFTLVTDSKAVTYLQTTKNLSAKLARWSIFLADFNFTMLHRAGKTLTNADGLSRS